LASLNFQQKPNGLILPEKYISKMNLRNLKILFDANCLDASAETDIVDKLINFTASAGTEYYIAVRGYEGSQGSYKFDSHLY